MTDLNLDLLDEVVEKQLPEKPGSSAPKSRIDEIGWTTPAAFTAVFRRRFLGKNADVWIRVETQNEIPRPHILKFEFSPD